jgi:hypothetical protein
VANVHFNDTITKDNPIACRSVWNKYCYKINLCRVVVFRKSKSDAARSRSVQLLFAAGEADRCLVDAPSRVDSRLKTGWMKVRPDLEFISSTYCIFRDHVPDLRFICAILHQYLCTSF